MPRILGINIPDNKRLEIALTYIYGVGRSVSRKIIAATDLDLHKKARDLSSEDIRKVTEFVQKNYAIEGDLRRERQAAIKRLKDIGSWRGQRHSRGLPTRGQQTRTNTRTVRGNVRKTTISGKRKLEKR